MAGLSLIHISSVSMMVQVLRVVFSSIPTRLFTSQKPESLKWEMCIRDRWEEKAKDLAGRFVKNFAKYEGNEHGKALVSAGPQL